MYNNNLYKTRNILISERVSQESEVVWSYKFDVTFAN